MRPGLLLLVGCTGDRPADPPGAPPAAAEVAAAPGAWVPPRPARNALVIVLDTTRADVVAAADTPAIDGLAASGADVARAWAGGTWTVPSVVSLLTGMFVRAHGWDLATGRLGRYPPLPSAPTLAEVLRAEGFTTHGFHANPYLSEQLGFDRGFDAWKRSSDARMPGQLRDLVEHTWTPEGRHFAYLHFIGPHSPLKPSPEARARHALTEPFFDDPKGFNIGVAKRNREPGARDAYARGYRAVVEDTDARVAAALDALRPRRADTLVVLTSDHGELLGEHGKVGHGHHVWEALTHVPLVVDHPALAGAEERLPAALSNAAVPDIVTRGLGVKHAWPVRLDDGHPLAAAREGRVAFSPDGVRKGLWDPDVAAGVQVFDLAADPDEAAPLPDTDGALATARAVWEAATPAGATGPDAVALHPDTVDQLRELGYLP